LVTARPVLQAALQTSQLCARAALGEREEADRLRTGYEAARRQLPSPTSDLRVYRALARLYREQGDAAAAEEAYSEALGAASGLHEAIVAADDRERFAAAQAALLAEAREFGEQAGRPGLVDFVATLFAAPEEIERLRAAEQAAGNRRRHRAGLALAGVDLAAGLGTLLYIALFTTPFQRHAEAMLSWEVTGAALFFFGGMTLLYSGLLRMAARWVPGTRGKGGAMTLYLAVLPWVAAVTAFVVPPRAERRAPPRPAIGDRGERVNGGVRRLQDRPHPAPISGEPSRKRIIRSARRAG
jgi:hypothetical protein